MTDEEKLAFIVQSKEEMRKYLRSLTWEQKVASIERMNAAGKIAREAMRKALEQKQVRAERIVEPCDVKPLA